MLPRNCAIVMEKWAPGMALRRIRSGNCRAVTPFIASNRGGGSARASRIVMVSKREQHPMNWTHDTASTKSASICGNSGTSRSTRHRI